MRSFIYLFIILFNNQLDNFQFIFLFIPVLDHQSIYLSILG